jgi:short-subunit dehydrogenase
MISDLRQLGDWALIAGGSEGVGACFARRLAAAGVNLVLLARKPEPLEALAVELRAASRVAVRTLSLDLTTADALDQMRAATDDLEVGMLICNAGSETRFGDFVDTPLSRAEAMIRLNVVVPTALAHHYGGLMKQRGRGGVILVGSMAGNSGCAKIAVYAAAKAYSQTFAEGLWAELNPRGVHVLGLVIGATRTPALERAIGIAHEGLADADEMAREGLEHLDEGPVWVAGGNAGAARHIRALPRAEAVSMMSRGTASLID